MKVPVLVPAESINKKVKSLAKDISNDYRDKQPIIICVLKGAFVFAADLIRHLTIPVRCDFVRLSSYNESNVSSGKIKVIMDIDVAVKGRDILIVDDIIDTGLTTRYLINKLKKRKPCSIKLCALLDKKERRITPVKIDYPGFIVPNKFVVGYGIDYQEKYRQLKYIGYVPQPK